MSVPSIGRVAIVLILCLLAAPPASRAQEESNDQLFARARKAEEEGRRPEAIQLCRRILQDNPGYDEVRVYLGRLHARDHDWDLGRTELRRVLRERPDHLEARIAAIDLELWAGKRHNALSEAEAGLEHHPNQPELLLRKARALDDLRYQKEALDVAREAYRLGPQGRDARRLIGRLEPLALRNKISVDYQHEWFDENRDPWRESSFEYLRRFRFGSVIGRVSQARRFQRTDAQYEIDSYPHLGPDTYLYLNVGWSASSDLYPLIRWGAEVFQELPSSWEVSGGVRRLVFDSVPTDTRVTLWTGSLGRYFGDNFVWGRLWYSNRDADTSLSGTIHWRRYFGHTETYTTVIAGIGSSAEEDFISQNENRLDSRVLRFEAQKWIGRAWVVKGQAGWRTQEFLDVSGSEWRDSWLIGAGFEKSF